MSSGAAKKFNDWWKDAVHENPPDPHGAAGKLVSLLGEALNVETVEYSQVESAALFLIDLSPLSSFKGLEINVVMLTHLPKDDDEARLQAEILNQYKDAAKSIGFCFYLILDYNSGFRNPFISSSLEAVYINGEDLERLVTARFPSVVLFEIISRQIGIKQLCPFTTNREARGTMFRGRTTEVSDLTKDMKNNYLVTGARRIGKTSLLTRADSILRSRPETRERTFIFNCLNWSDYWDCAHRLTLKIDPHKDHRLELGSRNLSYLLQKCSMGGSRPLILFFDECDRLITEEKMRSWPFLGVLQEATSKNWARVTFSGFRLVQELSSSTDSPFFGAIKSMEMRPFSPTESHDLLYDPFNVIGIPFKNHNYILDKVQKNSEGHPFVIQFYGERLFTRAVERSPQEVLPEDVDEIEEGFELSNFLKSHFLWNTSISDMPALNERLCALVFALHGTPQGWTEIEFRDECIKHIPGIRIDDIQKALSNLYFASIFGFLKGKYSFTFPQMKNTIIQLYPTVKDLLMDINRS